MVTKPSIVVQDPCTSPLVCKTCNEQLTTKNIKEHQLCNLERYKKCKAFLFKEKHLRKHQRKCKIMKKFKSNDLDMIPLNDLAKTGIPRQDWEKVFTLGIKEYLREQNEEGEKACKTSKKRKLVINKAKRL